ncbi:hypothetical protein TVAG_028190 [Trichomonas vaginalis G3]|uniref:Uncharacterized protein n=1 Tax=Trichomonas vaginalis (strain ATCC PRA-98 / G3) TaxID=412133 RepID=A2E558_TRIV3|nr:hypothetical protein TVAGG3_0419460 [Trichomonas vaginalis G3]EAY12266.1 hypothetical protein TVAG_028190 [Trichomonas vaginalis G3]KAI5535941.1 hypothetical protein TVAGG3_0419460 [Trichomonas vaginalis G3]|eukprot:XP_001324489.1 hypothetical protein [Trichomonas vaginalis G3]
MILDRKYIGINTYASLDFKIYQLVFEHNITETTKCFKSIDEAKRINIPGKFSILYDLNNSKYIMDDILRHFIIELPELKLINAWKQKNSLTEELEVSGQYSAAGFTPQITEAPMSKWKGLVHSRLLDTGMSTPYTYLDGNPGIYYWHFPIGMFCNAPSSYQNSGMPAHRPNSVKRISLWSAISEYQIELNKIKYSCILSIYNSLAFDLLTLIFICS